MPFPYVPVGYTDLPSTATPTNAADLNKTDVQVQLLTSTLMAYSAAGPCASRPAASAVLKGGFYFCTDTATLYETDGLSTWTAVATVGGGGGGGAVGAAVPGVRRLQVFGHSYNTYADLFPGGGWVRTVAGLVGIEGGWETRQIPLPAQTTATDTDVLLHVADDDLVIERVLYQPAAAMSAGRVFKLWQPGLGAWDVVQNVTMGAIPDPANGKPAPIALSGYDPRDIVNLYQINFGTFGAGLWHDNAGNLRTWHGQIGAGSSVRFQSLHGAGVADPGGVLQLQVGNRVRNGAIGGALLMAGGVYAGGWAKAFLGRSPGRGDSIEVDVSAASGTTITCDPIQAPIASGTQITFRGAVTVTLTANAAAFATSLSVNTTVGVVAGMQGWTNDYNYGQSPGAVTVLNWGINDAGSYATFDTSAWGQSLRAVIAAQLCSYANLAGIGGGATNGVNAANIRYTNGTGGGGWFNVTPIAGGQFPGTAKAFIGGFAGSPTVTIDIGPNFEGGTLDLFFYAIAGVNHGGAATITVDGAAPPAGVCRIDTHNVSLTNGVITIPNVSTTNTSPNISTSTAPPTGLGWFVPYSTTGAYLYGAGIPNLASVDHNTGAQSAVMSNPATATGTTTVTMCTLIPMVKRLTGLSPGAHSIVITLTSLDATTGAFFFAGYGWEAQNPTAGVVVCNCARILNTTVYVNVGNTDTNVAALNAETVNVLSGTSALVGTNTAEPALPNSVVLADINTALGPANPNSFQADGIHPNQRGQAAIAATVAQTIRQNLTLAQVAAR